jgi:hypothetical protein
MFQTHPGSSIAHYNERRAVPRYTFAAVAELSDTATVTGIKGKIAEISRKGCYVDSLTPPLVGTLLTLRISCDQGTFATKGKVIYAREQNGMGVAFVDAPPDQLKILDSWLSNLPANAAI